MDLDAFYAQLERHEGERLHPYDDATGKDLASGDRVAGNISIAIGVNLSAGISPEESRMLTDSRIDGVLEDLETFAWWPGLSDARQRAVADIRFNVGADGFRLFRKLIHALAVGNFQDAANEIRSSQIASKRKEDNARMMEQG